MKTKTLKVRKPLDPHTREILKDVDELTRSLGRQYLVIGALARELVVDHVLQKGAKATRDVDCAVTVDRWDTFTAIKDALLATTRYEGSRHPHRLKHRASHWQVDIIPFDGVEAADGTIAWPPDLSIVMNVTGLKEALQSSIQIEVLDNLVIPVASVPALFILKLFAWNDRRMTTAKDAEDLWRILTLYVDLDNQDRLYDQHLTALEVRGYDAQRGGAYLLGFDIASIAAPETMQQLQGILDPARRALLASDIATASRRDVDARQVSEQLLADLLAGMQDQVPLT